MQCPNCTTEMPDADAFCEACGTRLNPTRPLTPGGCSCGAPSEEIDEEGFCQRCGHRARRPDSDHMEDTISAVCAAVSDRGLVHRRNEDRFAIHHDDGNYALVVCDGVSASRESELASESVSKRVAESLSAAIRNGGIGDAETVMRRAIAAGDSSLEAYPATGEDDNPPSTTVVAAMIADGHATIGWVGDSRAYWIDTAGARQLTSDHSWMNEAVAAGEMTLEEAAKAPQAHAITRWLGADAGESASADTACFPLSTPGVLLLCTDGLWNYAQTPEEMTQLVKQAMERDPDALEVARHLIASTLAQGAQDNVTAVLLKCESPVAAQG